MSKNSYCCVNIIGEFSLRLYYLLGGFGLGSNLRLYFDSSRVWGLQGVFGCRALHGFAPLTPCSEWVGEAVSMDPRAQGPKRQIRHPTDDINPAVP